MARPKRFHVLVATDGSASAKAAVDTAVRFPWPDGAAASGIVVREVRADYRSSILLTALDQRATAAVTRRCPTGAIVWLDDHAGPVKGPAAKKILRKGTRPAAAT